MFETVAALRGRAGFGEALGAIAFLTAVLARFALEDTLPPGFPYLTFFPAVILTAFFGGVRAGIGCAIACGVAAWYWFLPPFGSFALEGPGVLALAFYVFIVSVDIALIHAMNVATGRLQREQALTAGLYDQQRTMFQELQHRVANNMQFVASLLSLQRRKAANDPAAAVRALDDAQERLHTISRIHRRLYDPSSSNLPVGGFLQELCTDLIEGTGARNIVCKVEAPAVTFDLARLTTLSLIVTEVVTNALKHAFPDGRSGTISIALLRGEDGQYTLTIRDDGLGLPPGFVAGSSKSLGMRIVQGLAGQLRGALDYIDAGGTGAVARLTFPA